jgi:dipeptidyl aminopeptidase/acylaminoacyl peptidase
MTVRKSASLWITTVIAFLCVGFSGPSAAQTAAPSGRALTIEDYYRIQSVGRPQISPNGTWVSYTVSTRIEEDNSTITETWITPSDGATRPRRILHYGRDVSGAAWTSDNRLRYSASGLWKINPADPASKPVRAESLPQGAVLSPDAAWIAQAKDRPQPKSKPTYASDFEKRHEERFKGVQFDWKDFQRDGAPFPAPDRTAGPAADIFVTPAAGGEAKQLTKMDLRPRGLTWHPNGRSLLFLADPGWRDELRYGDSELWMVTLDGDTTRLTDDGYTYSSAAFSPNGEYISYIRRYGTDMVIEQKLDHGGPSDLFVRPTTGGNPVNLTEQWDLEPRGPRWSPDGRYLYFTAGIGGASHLFRVAAGGGSVEQVTKGERRLNGLNIDSAFRTITYTVGLAHTPGEVFTADINGANERQLTEVHKNILDEISFSKAERLNYTSYDGTAIEGWMLYPYGYQPNRGPYPLIVFSHGGPHSADGYSFNFKRQFSAANGYFVMYTNFRSSTGYGEDFKWATWGEWGKKDGEDVMAGIDYVLQKYPIDRQRVGHTGHSYGGFMTNWLITQYPDRFAAAITGAGISNWISDYGTADIFRTKETEFYGTPWDPEARERMIKQSPLSYAGRVRTPTLFVHGELDQRVPYEEAEQMYFALKRRGVPAKMIQYADQAHGIRGHWNNVHRTLNELRWWNKYLARASVP